MKLFAFILILSLNISIGSTKYVGDEELTSQLTDLMRDVEQVKDRFDFLDSWRKRETLPSTQPPMQPSMMPSQKPMQPSMMPSQNPMQPSMMPSQKPMQPSMMPSQKPMQPSMMPSQKPMQPSMMPSQKPMQPSMPSQKPEPEKPKVPAKFMITSLMKKVGDLLFTMQTVREIKEKMHKMETSPKPGMMPHSSLVKIAISQLNQVFWGMCGLGRMMKNNMGPNPKTSGSNDEMKTTIVDFLGDLFQLLKIASDGKMEGEDVQQMMEAVQEVKEGAPKLLKRLKQFKEMLESMEKIEGHHNGTDGTNSERLPIISLVKLTSLQMEKMFWTMAMVDKMKMALKERMTSGDNKPNEKEMMKMKMMLKMKVGFMKMAMLRLMDSYWTMKKLKGMFEEKYEEKVGPIGTEQPKLPEMPTNHMSDESFFEIAKDITWHMHEMLEKCAKAMEEMKGLPMMIDGHMIWERLPVKKMAILQLMNEMIKTTPRLLKQMGMFKEKLENAEDKYGEEDHEDKRTWSI